MDYKVSQSFTNIWIKKISQSLEYLNKRNNLIMSEHEEYHDSHVGEDSKSEEVIFKEVVEEATSSTVLSAPPEIVTKSDLQEVIEGWKIKFQN